MKINIGEYMDKVYACWVGKNIGGTLGSPDDSSDEEDADKGKKKPDQDNQNDEGEETPTDKKKTRKNAYYPIFDPFV